VNAPGSGNPEVVVVGPAAQVDDAVRALEGVGGRLLRTRTLGSLGLRLLIFEYPRGRSLLVAQNALQGGAPDMIASFHSIYRFSQFRPRTYASQLVAAGSTTGCRLPRSVRIGMIDGPVDAGHPALASGSVNSVSLLRDSERAAQDDHGTAIAALMVGQDESGVLSGFAQGARLFTVAIFASRWGREQADVERIAAALDYLLSRNVRLINMSFSGPENAVLRIVLDAAAAGGAIMVAAVGNDGSAQGMLPASSGSVISVTAVDSRMRRFSAANTGPHVEFAAPGVDVYAAKSRRGGYVTGTSFATPFVTSVAAGLLSRGTRALSTVRRQIRATAFDLGAPGKDPEFGWGLARVADCRP
jgi:subtilisin family serine protease